VKIRRAGLIGYPLGKSLSPLLFEIFSSISGLRVEYDKIPVTEEKLLAGTIERLRSEGYCGFNVTVPYKRAVFPFMREADRAASCCGAVNAVKFGRYGPCGFNTDAAALRLAAEERGYKVAGKTVFIFGAGGAALSSACALASLGAAVITFKSRNPTRAGEAAAAMKKRFGGTVFSSSGFEEAGRADINVNATPVGMYCGGDIPCSFGEGTFAADLPYGREKTDFIKRAEAAGAVCADGLELLARQAVLSFSIWTGYEAAGLYAEAEKELRKRTGDYL